MFRKNVPLALAFIIITTSLSGCGGGSTEPSSSVSPPAASGSAEMPFNGSVAPSDPVSEMGGTGGTAFTYDGVPIYGQCVPGLRRYYQAHLGITYPFITVGNTGAYHLWNEVIPDPSTWIRIPYDLSGFPQESDMIVMNAWSSNPYGHVAMMIRIVDVANRIVEVMDSNWAWNEQGSVHNLKLDSRILGYYRPRPTTGSVDIPGNGVDEDRDGSDTGLMGLSRCYKNVSGAANNDWQHKMIAPGETCDGELDGHGFSVIPNYSGTEEIDLGFGYRAARLYECSNSTLSEFRYVMKNNLVSASGWTCTPKPWYVGSNISSENLGAGKIYEGYIPAKTTYLYGSSTGEAIPFGGTENLAFWSWNAH